MIVSYNSNMTKTKDQVQPDWEAIRDSMEIIGDLSNQSIDPERRLPFNEWIIKVIKGVKYSKERDAIGVILEYEVECRKLDSDEERFKYMREGIKKAREILRYIKTGIPPSDEAPVVPGVRHGDFEYRDEVVYCFDIPLKLSPQSKKIMKILIERSTHTIDSVEVFNVGNHEDCAYNNIDANNKIYALRKQLEKTIKTPAKEVIQLLPGTRPSQFRLTDNPILIKH